MAETRQLPPRTIGNIVRWTFPVSKWGAYRETPRLQMKLVRCFDRDRRRIQIRTRRKYEPSYNGVELSGYILLVRAGWRWGWKK